MFCLTFTQDFMGEPMRQTRWFDQDQKKWALQLVEDLKAEGATDVSLREVEPATSVSSVSFTGTITGDGECFCWADVSAEEKGEIADLDEYSAGGVLYPDEVLRRLGCTGDKKYRFTISAEEI